MNEAEFLEYNIDLSTGENIKIAEFDSVTNKFIWNHEEELHELLNIITKCNRKTIEDAKKGYSKDFEKSMKAPPYGCLLKLKKPICSEKNDCVSYKPKTCTTKNIKKKLGQFPDCWNFWFEDEVPYQIRLFANRVIHYWREGFYVVIVHDED